MYVLAVAASASYCMLRTTLAKSNDSAAAGASSNGSVIMCTFQLVPRPQPQGTVQTCPTTPIYNYISYANWTMT